MQEVQSKVEESELEVTAGGGAITVKVNGKRELLDIEIKPEVVDPDDVEMLQDLIVAAVNEAIRKADEMVAKEMGKITGGMNIPGLF
jgi:DNA-binding YbaB/EbfC family protein